MRNGLEKRVAAQLGPSWEYEAIKLTYTVSHTYLPDFIDRANKVIVETKGYFPAEDRRKMLAVKQQHPDWTIRIAFTKPETPVSKGSSFTYADWCDKHGIAWERAPSTAKRPPSV